jgi:hypothetical protein
VVEGRTGDTKTAASQEGVPIVPVLQKITNKYWEPFGMPGGRIGLRQMFRDAVIRIVVADSRRDRNARLGVRIIGRSLGAQQAIKG